MLLVVSNTIAMGVREKTVDLSTLRALGFRPKYLVALVLGESTTIGLAGAVVGVALSPLIVRAFGSIVSASFGSFPAPHIRFHTAIFSAAMSVVVGIAAGALPALHAARFPVAEGLRREA
jgi:putative ABC transport system permease protein